MSKFNTFKEGVKLVALLQASLEQMDELKGTVLYKQKLKQQLGNTEKMLERALTNPLAALDKEDPDLLTRIQSTGNSVSVDIHQSTSSSFVSGGLARGIGAVEPANVMVSCSANVLVSPNTTSAITYTVYFANNGGSTAYYGRNDLLTSLTAFEIGA